MSKTILCHCECGQKLNAPPSHAGKSFKCPKCGKLGKVPATAISDVTSGSQSTNSNSNSYFNLIIAAAVVLAIGVISFICLDVVRTSRSQRLMKEMVDLIQAARTTRAAGDLRVALSQYEDAIKLADSSKNVELADLKKESEMARDELRAILKEQLEEEERLKKEQEELAKRQEEESKRLAREQAMAKAAAEKAAKEAEAARIAEKKRQERMLNIYRNPPAAARAALNAMKKLDARIEVGINYTNYSEVVGESWGEVRIFVESPEGKEIPEFSQLMELMIDNHKKALDIWRSQINDDAPKALVTIYRNLCWQVSSTQLKIAERLISPDVKLESISEAVNSIKISREIDHKINLQLPLSVVSGRYGEVIEAAEEIESLANQLAKSASME